MKKKISISMTIALMIIAASLTFVISAVSFIVLSNSQLEQYSTISKKFNKLFNFDEIISSRYVRDIDEDTLMDGILKGYVYGLDDEYSNYLDKETYLKLLQSLNSTYAGIGIKVIYDKETGYIKVYNVVNGSPAHDAGVKIGDLITNVEGKDVLESGYYSAIADLQGETDSVATFTVARGLNYAEAVEMSVVRKEFETQSVSYKVVNENIGYIRFEEFTSTTPDEFNNAVKVLTEMDVTGLIFDVRNNTGGELDSISSVLDKILPEGVILTTKDKNGDGRTITSDNNCIDMPMAVLINGSTYSAAELFAAALRDYDVATLVGLTTYGKGMMQSVIPLGDGSAVSLTTEFFNPPCGENFNGVGVSPDIESELPDELADRFYELNEFEDVQLQAAIKAILGVV